MSANTVPESPKRSPVTLPRASDDIEGFLASRLRGLTIAYSILITLATSFVLTLGILPIPDLAGLLVGATTFLDSADQWVSDMSPMDSTSLIFVATGILFGALMALGGGRIGAGAEPVARVRLVVPVLATALAMASLGAGIGSAGLLLVEEYWPSDQGLTSQLGDVLDQDQALWILTGILFVSTVCIGLGRRPRENQIAALRGLILTILFVSYVALGLATPVYVTVNSGLGDEGFVSGLLDAIAVSLPIWLALFFLLVLPAPLLLLTYASRSSATDSFEGTRIGRLLFRRPGTPTRVVRSREERPKKPGAPYMVACRQQAGVLLVLIAFGVMAGSDQALNLAVLSQAHKVMATRLVVQWAVERRTLLSSLGDLKPSEAMKVLRGKGDLKVNRAAPPMQSVVLKPVGAEDEGPESRDFDFIVSLFAPRRPTGIDFRVDVAYEQHTGWVSSTVVDLRHLDEEEPLRRMQGLARTAGIAVGRETDVDALFFALEREVLARRTLVPGMGIQPTVTGAVWLCVIGSLVLLVMIMSHLDYAASDASPGQGEPWLLLDARSGAANVLARLWFLTIAAGPWILSQQLVRILVATWSARGEVEHPLRSGALLLAASLALAGNAWFGISVSSRLWRLRQRRRSEYVTSP